MTSLETPKREPSALDALKKHPEFGDEQLYLSASVEALQRAVDAPLKIAMGDFAATLYLENYRAWRRQELREAVQSPYFARIDFKPDDRKAAETYYIGKTYFAEGSVEITGWQAPVAALFYLATTSRASYEAPMGKIAGDVLLKRRLVVEHTALRHVADDLDERPLTSGTRQSSLDGSTKDDFLRAILSDHASAWLRDIIVTIQADQYALITAPANRIMLIQGVAGSGKTSIALHRLSYLVYPELAAGKLPPRCIVFGPNQLFLKYVSAVLPKLGLHHVVQTTIAEWAMDRLGLAAKRVVDPTFDALLATETPREEKDRLFRRSRLKTSERTATLIERYVEWRRDQVHLPDDGWLFRQTVQVFPGSLQKRSLERRLNVENLRAAHAKHAARPFALHRALFMEDVLGMVTSLFEANVTPADAQAQTLLGRKRIEQSKALRVEANRLRAQLGAGVAGASGSAAGARPAGRPEPRTGRNETLLNPGFSVPSAGSRPALPARPPALRVEPTRPGPFGGAQRENRGPGTAGTSGAASSRDDALLRQSIRQIELAAERRQQEGEAFLAEARATETAALAPEIREQALKGARAEVKRLVDTEWPPADPLREYFALLDDTALLEQLGEGIFDAEELALIAMPNPSPTLAKASRSTGRGRARVLTSVDATDLPALHYLFILTQPPDDMGAVNHDYVVVDETQDLSPLDLICLRKLERKQAFSMLGDVSQSIYAHRGTTSWDASRDAFGDRPTTYEECAVSYRTTSEITALANRVLTSLGNRTAQAFDRHGPEPVLTRVANESAVPDAIVSAVEALHTAGHRSVAVIAKTPARARELWEALETRLPGAVLLGVPDVEYEGGTVIVPVALAKGLEFDAAVVVDTDAQTYSPTAFDARLLYVALTRAMHELHLIWSGELSSHVAGWRPSAAV
jgi:DNA helicase IV